MKTRLSLERMLGPSGANITAAMKAGLQFLEAEDPPGLLKQVGRTIRSIPLFRPIDKSALQDSFGGNQAGPSDDFLVGRGLFYLTEQRKLFLDCTSGHYQMLWGYNHPDLCAAITAASRAGVIWDNHSNIPQSPLKWLAHRLVSLGNAPGEQDPLDTVLLGVCTGSVACAAALKIQLRVFAADAGQENHTDHCRVGRQLSRHRHGVPVHARDVAGHGAAFQGDHAAAERPPVAGDRRFASMARAWPVSGRSR